MASRSKNHRLKNQLSRRSFLKGSAAGVTLFTLGVAGCSDDADSTNPQPNNGGAGGTGGQGGQGGQAGQGGVGGGTPVEQYDPSGRPQQPASTPVDDRTPILWVETGMCTGCVESLLDSVSPPSESLLTDLRLEFQETLMDLSGAAATDRLEAVRQQHAGSYVLVIDGAIPTGTNAAATVVGVDSQGTEWTAEALVQLLAPSAAAVVALGTCACWGGIPAAGSNPMGYGSVVDLLGTSVIRVPGCPPHPAWIANTLTALLNGTAVPVNADGLPIALYDVTVHEHCGRKHHYKHDEFATEPGDPNLCLFQVGCRGPDAPGDCMGYLWNGQSSCIDVGYPCLGCTMSGYPDAPLSTK